MLQEVPDDSIQLVVTSPPYNLGKEYESRLHLNDYVSQQREVITECVRVLSDTGSICWQVGNYVDDGAIIPLDSLLYPLFASLGLKMRNRIVWHFEHGLHCSRRLSGRYETILWFTKGNDYVFELDPIRVPQKYPGKKYFKGPKAGQYSCNPLGKNPGDVWMIPNVKSNHIEKTGHPCQFPVELIERLVLSLTRAGGSRSARDYGYTQHDRDAVRHLYRVSAGLDAMILGESQIQGQVREAWEASKPQAGPVLHRLFQSALLVGARVRSETGLATGTASAPSAAVAVAARIFTRLAGRSALILGAGDIAELAATCLVSEGVRVTVVANRTYERARAIAEELGARALTLDDAWEHFATADIVLSSTAAPHAVVTWDRVAPAVARRGGRPLCILDLAVPRDVEPAVAQLENVFLYDIDDLQAVAAQAAAGRRRDIPAAERIVGEEVERFWAWYGGLAVVPVLKEFRDRMDHVRAAELDRVLRRLAHLSPDDRGEIAHFSEALLNKFLHAPTIAVKEAAQAGRGYGLLEALKRLFGLEGRDVE